MRSRAILAALEGVHHGGPEVYVLWCWIDMHDLGSSWIHQRCYRVVMVEDKGKQATGEKQSRKPWTLREVGGKTLWDWLQLLIVPIMLSLITVAFTWQQDTRQQRFEDQRAQQAQRIENQRAAAEREIQEQRAQQATLQAYIDQMGTLLLDRGLRNSSEDSDVRRLARARTLVVLDALSSEAPEQGI